MEHAVHIQKWNNRSKYVCYGERIEEVMSCHHPYMVWYRRITRLYIDRDSAKMEILVMCTNLVLQVQFDVMSVSYIIMPMI